MQNMQNMQDKSESFQRIINEGNVVLEAGIVKDSLVFKLMVTKQADSQTLYYGEIKDLKRYERLKERYHNLEQVLEYVKDGKNVRLDLERLCLKVMIGFDDGVIEGGEIFLKRGSRWLMGDDGLQEMMRRCCQGDSLDDGQILRGFGLLARELLQLKRCAYKGQQSKMEDQVLQQLGKGRGGVKGGVLEVLKEERLCEGEMKVIRGQFEEMNKRDVIVMDRGCEQNYGRLQRSMCEKINDLDEEIRNLREELSEYLNERVRQAQDLKKECVSNLEYSRRIECQVNQLYFYMTGDEQKVDFYKNEKWGKYFAFDGRRLLKIKDDYNRYQFLFDSQVPYDQEYSFIVKIVRSDQKTIMIGVVDYQKQRQKQFSYNSNNAVCYNAKAGNKWPGAVNEGSGVGVGETVEVRVDRKNSTIGWYVNNEQRARHESKMLGEKNRVFVPFVEMYEVGDIIEWSLVV